jgi:hypothetical protein
LTTAGRLPFKAIIHVAGISLLWRSSERSIRDSVRNAMAIAQQRTFQSVAIPLIGAGSGGGNPHRIQTMIEDELTRCPFDGDGLHSDPLRLADGAIRMAAAGHRHRPRRRTRLDQTGNYDGGIDA